MSSGQNENRDDVVDVVLVVTMLMELDMYDRTFRNSTALEIVSTASRVSTALEIGRKQIYAWKVRVGPQTSRSAS